MASFLKVMILVLSCYMGKCIDNRNITTNITISTRGRRIVGGEEADIRDFPFMVSIQHNHRHFCGGTLLTYRWVLTASHCIMDRGKRKDMFVLAGSEYSGQSYLVYWLTPLQIRYPQQFIMHPKFDMREKLNDIGLISLTRRFYRTSSVSVLKLPERKIPNSDAFRGNHCTALGWGLINNKGQGTYWLKKVSLPVIDTFECRKRYFFYQQPDTMFICTHTPGKDACKGDSGGPLILDGVQIGLVSYGINCADPYWPGVFTRIDSYLDWIEANSHAHRSACGSVLLLALTSVLAFG